MKRKTDEPMDLQAQILQIHHMLEALHDSIIEDAVKHGLAEEFTVPGKEIDLARVNELTSNQGRIVASLATVSIIHNAVHEIMEHGRLSKLTDKELLKTVQQHVPHIIERDMLEGEAKDKFNRILERD